MNRKVLIDTDILSYYLKGYPDVVKEFDRYESSNGPVLISRISVVEILSGLKAKNAVAQIDRFRQFLQPHQVVEITGNIGETASDIYANLYQNGHHSGSYDLLIAATAIIHKSALCTNNLKDYQHIPGLELINWRKR